MHPTDTIFIFQKPELYFFPHYKGLFFAPFKIPEKSLRYLIYKSLYLLHLPCCSIFWGKWKEHISEAKQVIIFDYGYQRGMETYIRRINPDCQIVIFYWNRIGRYNSLPLHRISHNQIYSTDPADCRRFQLKYNHIFYPREYFTPSLNIEENRLIFIGTDKGRLPYIAALEAVLKQGGLSCDIRVLSSVRNKQYRRQYQNLLTDAPVPYEEYRKQLDHCNVLLDICQTGQTALTMRVLESIYLSKKLITQNQDIIHYDFYNPDNIFLLPENGQLPAPQDIQEFLQKPFVPYPETILQAYSYEDWLSYFCK